MSADDLKILKFDGSVVTVHIPFVSYNAVPPEKNVLGSPEGHRPFGGSRAEPWWGFGGEAPDQGGNERLRLACLPARLLRCGKSYILGMRLFPRLAYEPESGVIQVCSLLKIA
jgi:hypothetical protein